MFCTGSCSDQINTMGVGIKVIGVYSTISQAKLYITPERILKGPIPYYDNSVHYNEPIPFVIILLLLLIILLLLNIPIILIKI